MCLLMLFVVLTATHVSSRSIEKKQLIAINQVKILILINYIRN
jgi:hypothetical protein